MTGEFCRQRMLFYLHITTLGSIYSHRHKFFIIQRVSHTHRKVLPPFEYSFHQTPHPRHLSHPDVFDQILTGGFEEKYGPLFPCRPRIYNHDVVSSRARAVYSRLTSDIAYKPLKVKMISFDPFHLCL